MKKKIFIALALLLTVSFGCEDDFLDRPDLDNITSDNFWKTPLDLELYATQFYTILPGWSPGAWNGGVYWVDGNSDNILIERATSQGRIVGNFTINSGANTWGFGTVRATNIFMDNYEKVDATFDEVKHYVGEVLFFRSWTYFNLVKAFGDVPWIDKPLLPDSEELNNARDPRKVVVDNILQDLDLAIEYMNSGKNAGGNRLSKECARLLKARVALYEGTWEKYHAGTVYGVEGADGANYLQIAADAAKGLIDNPADLAIYNTGSPDTDYSLLFNQESYAGNSEVMLWRHFSASENVTHNGQRYLPRFGGGRGITKSLVDAYLATDGLPIESSPLYVGDGNLIDVSTNRDYRLSQTVWITGQLMATGRGEPDAFFERPVLESDTPSGYRIKKGANIDRNQYHTSGVGTTSSPVMRLAEALLIYAEARAELGSLTQSDLDMTVNVLRDRAGVAHLDLNNIASDPNWQFPGLSPIINEIRRERRVELAAEGYRFDDLMRWRAHDAFIGKRLKGAFFVQEDYPNLVIGTTVMVDEDGYIDPHQTQMPDGFGFDPVRDYLLAVPQQQITLNSNLTQNPGW